MTTPLQYSDATDAPFANSPPEVGVSRMLPVCLRDRVARGEFTSVSTLARSLGIEQTMPYNLVFSPTNNTYALTVGDMYTIYGDYVWSLAQNFRASDGGGQDTSHSVLELTPAEPLRFPELGCTVRATDRNAASFTSALGLATFDLVEFSSRVLK